MDLIVISDPVSFPGEADLINRLFDAGMAIFHLRKPGIDQSEYASLLSRIAKQYHDRIALHQFHELAKDFAFVKRIHFPEQLRKEGLKDIASYTLSTSIHHLKDLNELKGFDYAFYGPVFNSISKPGYTGLAAAELILPDQHRDTKIIGLGGIDDKKVQSVKQMGFDGIAVLGTIWNNRPQAIKTFNALKNKYKEHFN